MTFTDLKTGRLAKGWSQVEAAGRLKVSQSYLAMLEGGVRRITPELARRAMRVYDLAPTALAPSELNLASTQTASETLAGDLAALGYPGLAYLRPRNWKPKNPGRSEEHTSELQSQSNLVCRLLLEKKKKNKNISQN